MSKVQLEGIKSIAFDFGGVVVDITREGAVKRFQEVGLANAHKIIDSYKQDGIFLLLEEGKLAVEEFCDELRKLAANNITNKQVEYAWMGFFTTVCQNRLNFINDLRKNYRVCLLSNTNPIVMSWARSASFSPEGKPLDAYFDKLYLSYQMGVVKPNAEIFKQLVAAEGVSPSEILFIDDAPANINAAEQLGIKTLFVKHGEDFRSFF